MPLSQDYWNSLFGGLGIDPQNSDAQNIFNSFQVDDQEPSVGLGMDFYDPAKELHRNSEGVFSDLRSWTNNVLLGVGSTALQGAATVTDILDSARKSVRETSETLTPGSPLSVMPSRERGFAWAGGNSDVVPPIDPVAQAEEKKQRDLANDNSFLKDWTADLKSGASLLSDMKSVNKRQMTEGGSLVDELQASIGLKGFEGYNPLDMASTMWKNKSDIDPMELAADTSAAMADIAGGMGEMAIEGLLLAPSKIGKLKSAASLIKESGDLIGTGMFMQTFADTYLTNTQGEDDSRLMAIGVSAISSAVQGYAEKIGWETGLGKGAIADLFKGATDSSRLQLGVMRAMYTGLTEGSEEVLQGITDVLAKATPSISDNGWDATAGKIYSDLEQQLPDQFAGGALFGMFSGGGSGMMRLGVADADARHGGAGDPTQVLAGALNKGPASQDAKKVLAEAASGSIGDIHLDSEASRKDGNTVVNPIVSGGVTVGGDAGNGFVYGAGGYRIRVSSPASTSGVLLEKRSPGGDASGFYIGNDGKLINAEEVNFADSGSKAKIWIPSSTEERSAAEAVLREASIIDITDPKRKEVLNRLKSIIAGKGATNSGASTNEITPIQYERSDEFVGPLEAAEMRRRKDKLRRLEKIARDSMAHKAPAEQAIVDEVTAKEAARKEIADTFTEDDVTKIGTAMATSIDKVGQEAAQKVGDLYSLWTTMEPMLSGAEVAMDNGDVESGTPTQGVMAQMSPEEAIGALSERAAQLGVQLPDALLSDPSSFDWTGWQDQVANEASHVATVNLAPSAKAITDAISVDPASPMHSISQALREPVVASQTPSISQILPTQQMNESARQVAAQKGDPVPTAAPKWYVPNVLPAAHVHAENNLLEMIHAKPVSQQAALQHIISKFGVDNVVAADIGPDLSAYTKAVRARAAGHGSVRAVSQAVANIEKKLLMQQVPDFDGVLPDIEALSTHTAGMEFEVGKSAHLPGAALTEQVAKAFPDDRSVETAAAQEDTAQAMVPWVKTALFNLWQTAPKALQDRVNIAISDNPVHDPTLGRDVMAHLASHGMYKAAAERASTDTDYGNRIGIAIGAVGKGVMSPFSIKRLMIENGVSNEVADSTLAVMSAMAERWSNANSKSQWEWWDRMGDQARLQRYKESNVGGLAHAVNAKDATTMQRMWEGGKGILNVFSGMDKATVKTVLHEATHSLFMSGLMWEMLDEDARAAMESFAKEKLWHTDGTPMKISAAAHEMLAVGFEKFIYQNKAPNSAMQAAFQNVKDFLRRVLYGWLNKTGLVGNVLTEGEAWNSLESAKNEAYTASYPAYQLASTGVDLKWGDFKMGLATTRAFYQLLNTEFTGKELKWMSPGAAVAYENALASATGLPAEGVITQMAPSAIPSGDPVGWQLDSGTTPTPEQWRKMTGNINEDSNGIDSQEATFVMEADRIAAGELSRDIKASPSAKADQSALTNKAVQESLSEEAPMMGSVHHDEMMDTFYNQLFAGGKDAFNGGKVLDFFNREHIKGMLENFASKMRSWGYLIGKNPVEGVKELSYKSMRSGLKAAVIPFVKTFKYMEHRIGSVSAPWERAISNLVGMSMIERQRIIDSLGPNATEEQKQKALTDKANVYLSMNLPGQAMALNNHYALSKLVEKGAEHRPQIWNALGTEREDIPGAKSFNEVIMDFTKLTDAFWKENKSKLPYRDVSEYNAAIRRDLRLYLAAARQQELERNAAEDTRKYEAALAQWEKKTVKAKKQAEAESTDVALVLPEKINKPKKPKIPKITEEGTHQAAAIMAMLNARYGKNISMFLSTASELTQWENHMVLDKLLNANMIDQKAYDDMVRKGKAHVPMYRLRAAMENSGMRNVRLDASVYRVLDYLKNDISISMEDPINGMLRKAKAIMALTERQHAKNALGNRILADIKWWDYDNPNSKMGIFTNKVEISEEEFNDLSSKSDEEFPFAISKKEVFTKTGLNTRVHKGFKYYKHIPMESAEVEEGLKHVVGMAKKRGYKGSDQSIHDMANHSIFAFYPKPGKAMYVYIADPQMADAFFYMNNPQAMFANSWKDRLAKMIGGMTGAQDNAELPDRVTYTMLKMLHSGFYGTNKVFKKYITSNLAFIYNVLMRDLPQAMARSRHGLRLRDIPAGFKQSLASMFPSIAEIDPNGYEVAIDASKGMSTFSGLAASNAKGELDADVIFELMRGRSDREAMAKSGDFRAKLQLMRNDFAQFLAKEGINKSFGQIASEISRGKNVGSNLLVLAKSPLVVPLSMSQALGTIAENTTRLSERRLSMSEDMSEYPSLVHKYDPAKAVQGKILAGFDGASHRRLWEKHKKLLQADPNHVVPENALPKQFDAHERDYSESNITLNFAQKGTWTQNIDDATMFFNPMAQDFYTNLMIIGQHSALKQAIAYAMGDQYVPSHNQPKLDEAAVRWIYKSIFYMTLPAIATMALYGTGDDDDSLDWQAQSFIEKMSYMQIPVNKIAPSIFKRPLRVANGLGLANLMFHDLPLATMLEEAEKDKKAMRKWVDRFYDSTPIGLIMNPMRAYDQGGAIGAALSVAGETVFAPESVNPILEVATDRDQFRNRNIKQDQSFDKREPSEVGSERYNILVNTIARNFNSSKLQPAQVDYLIRRYFPGALKALPQAVNSAMELATGAEHMPPDVMASNSPLARPATGFLPKVFTVAPWGMGNEFVRDLLNTAQEATEKRNTYDGMIETRRPKYLAENKLIQDDIYWGKVGPDGGRSGGLQSAAQMVINKDKEKRMLLKAGRITKLEASMMEREYTLFAMHAMTNVLNQLGGE